MGCIGARFDCTHVIRAISNMSLLLKTGRQEFRQRQEARRSPGKQIKSTEIKVEIAKIKIAKIKITEISSRIQLAKIEFPEMIYSL